jgi:hypothetical protein
MLCLNNFIIVGIANNSIEVLNTKFSREQRIHYTRLNA